MSDPVFLTPSTNPLGLADVGFSAKPTFVDIDGDGDLDAFVGNSYGNASYENKTSESNHFGYEFFYLISIDLYP